MTIRVLLADDQSLIRAGFRMFVEPEPDIEVVGEAVNGWQAVERARSERADVVLMDLRMPEMDGLEATRRIAQDENLAGVRVLVLTTFEDDDNVFRALRAGAGGFLGKHVDPPELVQAIRVVAAGESLLSPAATRSLIGRFLAGVAPVTSTLDGLTGREREVLALVAQGLTNAEIAARLHLSPLTVKSHLARVMSKLAARDRAQLVVMAYQSGLVRRG